MLVCDGPTGLPDAVNTVWPATIVQTCVVHLLRNSFRYVARQDWEKIVMALRPVCTAPTERAAPERLVEFTDAWGGKYPAIVRLWENAWAEFVPFLRFDVEIRKAVRARGHFPHRPGRPPKKCVYLAVMSLDTTGTGRKRWAMRWKAALQAFNITFDGRSPPDAAEQDRPSSTVRHTGPSAGRTPPGRVRRSLRAR